jgi:DNA polymerase elongation subunit (family B)
MSSQSVNPKQKKKVIKIIKKTKPKQENPKKDICFRLLDFHIYNEDKEEDNVSLSDSSSTEDKFVPKKDNKQFIIQIFGLDENGKTYTIYVDDYQPYFYMKVPDNWSISTKNAFLDHIKRKVGKYNEDSIVDCKLIKRHELYGFNDNKEFNFVMLKFKNTFIMNRVKNFFYHDVIEDGNKKWKLNPIGYNGFNNTSIYIYESNIPPLLRYFHIQNISPSGWVTISVNNLQKHHMSLTTSNFEFTTKYRHIQPLNDKETIVPYKICSFDIEASSSHGDFPVPVKNYKRLAVNILEHWENNEEELNETPQHQQRDLFKGLVQCAFGYGNHTNIDLVYPKTTPENITVLDSMIDTLIAHPIYKIEQENKDDKTQTIIDMIEDSNKIKYNSGDDGCDNGGCDGDDETNEDVDGDNNTNTYNKQKYSKTNSIKNVSKTAKVIDVLNNTKLTREEKVNHITKALNFALPRLEGDKVTFIGSTFMRYGEKEPYLNHCIALDTCTNVNGAEIECYDTEKKVLLAWTQLIQRENPDIIIGYNIFGFDYRFMFYRAQENGISCLREFLKLSRNKDEICGQFDKMTGSYKIEETSITIASGTHNLNFIKMTGRIQIDLYNYLRREYNLTSYKLDYVSGNFIGDSVKSIETNETTHFTTIKSKNLTGLHDGNFIHIEETGHTSEYYKDGAKFEVFDVNENDSTFKVKSCIYPDMKKKVKWCLAKDDVTPQDIFRYTREGPEKRAIVAKYCIQDCNLVHYLLNKIDVITGFVEMANICSVPIDFLIMRGQGIKLFSFIAKQCREAKTLIPVLEKKNDGGYEGAIVLPPKCGLYLDEPVACVDYSSLYPSSMISENLSHDSKVWTREYDLEDNLIEETGVKDNNGNFIYDNLPEYKYVNVTYDTYTYIPNKRGKLEKTLCGKKTCRFAQFPDGKLAIMPRILKELLAARKATRTQAKFKTVFTSIGNYSGLVIDKNDNCVTLKDKNGNIKIIEQVSIMKMEDTYDDFMKNVLDKRQLAIKVTANSLYGQCGAKTSSFYEKDVAASTTATGRKLLTYGKRIIEEVYGDRICETSYGKVHSHAEYIYGDTDSVFMSFKLTKPNSKEKIVGNEALKITIELAQEAGELATKFLKDPHDLEYEKTFMPFCLLSKKRYVGMLYETDPNVCYRKSMGIVLKRRDNAPIVKDVYGGIIDILMKEQNLQSAVNFTQNCLSDIVDEKYPLEKLIITKSLNGFYKNPQQIAHKVLADRMAKRDPGNKPNVGDRIPFVYIQTEKPKKGGKILQGDKVEHPDFIRENKIKPDYSFYITNQIMKPVSQVFALVLEQIPSYASKSKSLLRQQRMIERKYIEDEAKMKTYVDKLRNKEVKELIFDDALTKCKLQKDKQISIKSFFGI